MIYRVLSECIFAKKKAQKVTVDIVLLLQILVNQQKVLLITVTCVTASCGFYIFTGEKPERRTFMKRYYYFKKIEQRLRASLQEQSIE